MNPMEKNTSTPKMIVHLNCSPYVEDQRWNITVESDYKRLSTFDSDESFTRMDIALGDMLDKGEIHSYYIQRPSDPSPIIHEYNT